MYTTDIFCENVMGASGDSSPTLVGHALVGVLRCRERAACTARSPSNRPHQYSPTKVPERHKAAHHERTCLALSEHTAIPPERSHDRGAVDRYLRLTRSKCLATTTHRQRPESLTSSATPPPAAPCRPQQQQQQQHQQQQPQWPRPVRRCRRPPRTARTRSRSRTLPSRTRATTTGPARSTPMMAPLPSTSSRT
jgi:hypothetical protein